MTIALNRDEMISWARPEVAGAVMWHIQLPTHRTFAVTAEIQDLVRSIGAEGEVEEILLNCTDDHARPLCIPLPRRREAQG